MFSFKGGTVVSSFTKAIDAIYCIRNVLPNTIYGFCFMWLLSLFPKLGKEMGENADCKNSRHLLFFRVFMSERISVRERCPSKALSLRLARPFRIEFCFSPRFSACFACICGLFCFIFAFSKNWFGETFVSKLPFQLL